MANLFRFHRRVTPHNEIATVCDVAALCFELPRKQVTGDCRLCEDLGADSIDILALLTELEQEFSVRLPDDAARQIRTLNDAVFFVHRQLA